MNDFHHVSFGFLPRIGVFDEDVLRLRVWPQDIDFNLHMNNAHYLSFMDYGRVHLSAVTGILMPALKEEWAPLVGSLSITYRRSLGLFAAFTLSTRTLIAFQSYSRHDLEAIWDLGAE